MVRTDQPVGVCLFVTRDLRAEGYKLRVSEEAGAIFCGDGLQAGALGTAHFLEEVVALFGGDFERAGKPAGEGAVEKGIADEEHEEDGKKRNAHGADDHLGFEAGAELVAATLHPEAEGRADENQ